LWGGGGGGGGGVGGGGGGVGGGGGGGGGGVVFVLNQLGPKVGKGIRTRRLERGPHGEKNYSVKTKGAGIPYDSRHRRPLKKE